MKVLILDEKANPLTSVEECLQDEGIDILRPEPRTELLKSVQQADADLVLVNESVGGVSAFDICQTIKTNPDLFLTPVVVIQNSHVPDNIARGLNVGATDCICRPFNKKEFVARIWAALRNKGFLDLLLLHAGIDPFTNLGSRKAMSDAIDKEFDRRKRYGGDFSVVAVSIDQYSNVLETHGPKIAGQALGLFAQELRKQCRINDFPARFSEDRFMVLAAGATAPNAAIMANRICKAVTTLDFKIGGDAVPLTVCCGVADTLVCESSEALILSSLDTLQLAQKKGGNCVEINQALGEKKA